MTLPKYYDLDDRVQWKNMAAFRDKCNQLLGRSAVITGDAVQLADNQILGNDLTPTELSILNTVNKRFEVLDSWEQSKLRNLTLDQINNEITARQNEINAATNLTQAKTAMLNLLTDDAKAWQIILWLLKREMNELG
jgi:hypothetical protein